MGYSNFKKIQQVTERFGLDQLTMPFLGKVKPVRPSNWLKKALEMSYRTPITNEKSKSERLVTPVLLEVSQLYADKISFFSGEEINIDSSNDLSGPCDFFFSLHPPKYFIEAPIFSIAEAKDEDMEWGVAQCAAQLYGAYLFNQQKGKSIERLYGCATTGEEWQFLKFENNLFTVEPKPYSNLSEVLGAWHQILGSFVV
jgi:hypothetical protein